LLQLLTVVFGTFRQARHAPTNVGDRVVNGLRAGIAETTFLTHFCHGTKSLRDSSLIGRVVCEYRDQG
jgi:hypothetical protein